MRAMFTNCVSAGVHQVPRYNPLSCVVKEQDRFRPSPAAVRVDSTVTISASNVGMIDDHRVGATQTAASTGFLCVRGQARRGTMPVARKVHNLRVLPHTSDLGPENR